MKCRNIIIILIILMICPVLFAAQLKNSFVDGTLGVGTNTPATKLHVVGTVTATGATISSSVSIGTTNPGKELSIISSALFPTAWLGESTTIGGVVEWNSVDNIMSLKTVNHNYPIYFGNNWVSFATNGRVGIGITTPGAILNADGGSATSDQFIRIGAKDTYDAGLQFTSNDGSSWVTKNAIVSESQNTWFRSNMHFILNNAASSADYTLADAKMTITYGGNVGIGITTPSTALHVIGTVTISSGIIVAGSTMTVPDYVFAENYKLLPIEELKEFVEVNKHLPEFESAKNTTQLNLVQDNMRLREAIEKLTLYLFEMKQEIADLKRNSL